MVRLRDHGAGDHDGSGLSLLQQMQMAHHNRKKTKISAAMSIVVCHVRSLLKSNRGKLRDVFLKLDKDGGGSIDQNEFKRGLMSLGIELQDAEVEGVFGAIDVNGDGDVSLREFMSVIAKPMKPIKLIFHDFFDGIRAIGVYISREHAIAVYEYCQTKTGGPIDPVVLEKLINDPVSLQQLHPNKSGEAHKIGQSGIPTAVHSTTYRFSNTTLSNMHAQREEARKEHERDLLHRTVKRVEMKFVTAAFRKWAYLTVADIFSTRRKEKSKSMLKQGEKKEEIVEENKKKDERSLEELDEEAGGLGDNMAAVANRKKAGKLRKLKLIQRRELLKRVQKHIQRIPRPHWNSSAVWPYRYKNMNVEAIPPLSKMFKQTSYWGVNCNPKPKVPPKHKQFHVLGSEVTFPISPKRPGKPLSSLATPSPRQLKQALNNNAGSIKDNSIRLGNTVMSTRHSLAIVTKNVDNIWQPPPRPTGHVVHKTIVPEVDPVDLNNSFHRIEQFDDVFAKKSPPYNKLMKFVTNPTPIQYPKIDYDVDGDNKFPNLDRLIEKYSNAQIAAQKRLAAVKERKRKLKREANEKALNRMVADAREMYSTV